MKKLDVLEEDVKYLKKEIEHKNSTITQLLDIVNKVTIRTQHTDTYNHDVDEYNDNVSGYNSTPVKSKDNVTVRKKRTTNLAKVDDVDGRQHQHDISSCLEESVEEIQKTPIPPVEDQLAEYKALKHTKFLSKNEGKIWDGSRWTEKKEVQETTEQLYSDADVEIINDMYQEYDRDEENNHDDINNVVDMSISVDESSNLERVYKKPLPPEALWRQGTTLIIGDSMIGGIEERRLRNTKVRPKPGASIEDMFFFITPYLRKNPTNIICHVGTNNARSDSAEKIMEKLIQLKEYIVSKCPSAKIVFSDLIARTDDAIASRVVREVNGMFDHLDTTILRNDNIMAEHLGKKGLHLSGYGTGRLAKNLIEMIKELNG